MPGNMIRNYFTKKIMELSIFNCETLIVNSVFAKKEISNILKINLDKVKVIYLGINDKYLSGKLSDSYLKNIDYNSKYILAVLSCVKYHNIINLLKAFKFLLNESDIKIKLVLVSQVLDKNYFKKIKDYIKINFQNNEIILINNLKGKYLLNLYKNAELYLFSSYCESFGFTSLEAMSQKCPVLISKNSALPEINSNACEYFNPDDEIEIKNKMYEILKNQTFKIELANRGYNHVQKFTWKDNLKNTISELLK
jgi:glycosyltransferase involved in cell wall biosynthesis